MAHVRQQIRAAIVTALTGLTTTGSNVFRSRILSAGERQTAGVVYFYAIRSGRV